MPRLTEHELSCSNQWVLWKFSFPFTQTRSISMTPAWSGSTTEQVTLEKLHFVRIESRGASVSHMPQTDDKTSTVKESYPLSSEISKYTHHRTFFCQSKYQLEGFQDHFSILAVTGKLLVLNTSKRANSLTWSPEEMFRQSGQKRHFCQCGEESVFRPPEIQRWLRASDPLSLMHFVQRLVTILQSKHGTWKQRQKHEKSAF